MVALYSWATHINVAFNVMKSIIRWFWYWILHCHFIKGQLKTFGKNYWRYLLFVLQINLIKVGEDGDDSNYINNSEWKLIKLHAKRNVVYYSCCAEPYPDVTYTIQMRRKPLFYVFNMIMPCMLITLVALLGFYIPSDSGEKVTMGITTLLSMTVFLMLVAENMPPTSDVLPLVGKWSLHVHYDAAKVPSVAGRTYERSWHRLNWIKVWTTITGTKQCFPR